MSPITHAILPLALGYKWIPASLYRPSIPVSSLIALSGALPDLLDPHITLEARYNSWSHTVLALGLFGVAVSGVCLYPKFKPFYQVGVLCIFAYALHIFCDLISGGGRPLLPFSRAIYGRDFWPSWAWGASDIILLLYLYIFYRWLPLRRRYNDQRKRSGITYLNVN